jgi:choline dehydrogenase-like flavoprotein
MPRDLVLGSGPSGVAAAAALIARGREVLMLDAGGTMESGSAALRARMGSQEPHEWSAADRSAIRTRQSSGEDGGIHPFGSDFLFRTPDGEALWADRPDVHALRPSFAKGGLSNGWGAAVLPYRDEDMDGWPIGAGDLAPHYAAVAPMLQVSGRQDDLAAIFPAFAHPTGRPLPPSTQATRLLARLSKRRDALRSLGLHFGTASTAVADGCRQCAMCLHGCPYRLIFSADQVVDRLVASGGLEYRPGVLGRRFEEDGTGVAVHADGEVFRGDRLFVGCGVLPTALLADRSLGLAGRWLSIKDSAHFFLPMLHGWSAGDPAAEPHHSLVQLFWELVDPELDPHLVHSQLYTYNDSFAPDIRRRFGPVAGIARPVVELLSRRLIVAQTFLHSDSSPGIGMRIAGPAGREHLEFRSQPNSRTAAAMKKAAQRLAEAARLTGMVALTPLARLNPLGSSFHCGGTFPMRETPKEGETDILGRPAGFRRVHLIDASVFPTIPASTITFSVMANAHRIATEAG